MLTMMLGAYLVFKLGFWVWDECEKRRDKEEACHD